MAAPGLSEQIRPCIQEHCELPPAPSLEPLRDVQLGNIHFSGCPPITCPYPTSPGPLPMHEMYLSCCHKSFLSQHPIRSRHRFQKGLCLKAPSCSHPPCSLPAAPWQYNLKQKSPSLHSWSQALPLFLARLVSGQPLPQWWDSGLLQTDQVLLVGFTADSCSGAGGCMGLCQQDTGTLFSGAFFFFFPKMASQELPSKMFLFRSIFARWSSHD